MELDLFQHTELRDRGMFRAADAQERAMLGFGEIAYSTIEAIARRQATVHVDDVLREMIVRPDHPNAWGAVWLKAIRARVIERTGTIRPCTVDAKKHSHGYPVYRSLVFGGANDRL